MSESCFIERLGRLTSLSNAEKRVLSGLDSHERVYRRGALIRPERDRVSESYIVNSGWLLSSILLGDGNRQILRVHLPGDIVGLSCAAYSETPESIVAVTDARVTPIERTALLEMIVQYPRLGALLFVIGQAEQVALHDRLASIGRTSARARIAALMVDTMTRLRMINDVIGSSFIFPLTQEEIGDATGLTSVHVNRMIRSLVSEGLIERKAGLLTIVDEKRLCEIASYVNRYPDLHISALPPSS